MVKSELLWLSDHRCQDPILTGNKAARLAQLVELRYNVPNGFCITTDILSTVRAGQQKSGSSGWRNKVTAWLDHLPSPWVVRSSSTAEDSRGLAFPGVFKTILGLMDADAVLGAVDTVTSSLSSTTSQSYAEHFGIDMRSIRMAVIVQTLVIPYCSGVAFSRDPVTGSSTVIINANYGLGDTVVDGSVSPDEIEVTEDGTVNIVLKGTKKLKTLFTSRGVIREDTSAAEQQAVVLTSERARMLSTLTRRIEADLGSPQDIEWALTGDSFFILQARPITTLGVREGEKEK